MLDLASWRWIDQHLNLLITGKTGVGKTYLGCALAHQACREGYTVLYRRMPKLFRELILDAVTEAMPCSYSACHPWICSC